MAHLLAPVAGCGGKRNEALTSIGPSWRARMFTTHTIGQGFEEPYKVPILEVANREE